jgi:hypothetical protein
MAGGEKEEESVEESDMGLLGHETYGLVKRLYCWLTTFSFG